MTLNVLIVLLTFNFIFIQTSNNVKIYLEGNRNQKIITDLDNEEKQDEVIVNSNFKVHGIRVNNLNTNTLMIDTGFQLNWIKLFSTLDNLVPKNRRQSRLNILPIVDPQIRLLSGIQNNDPRTVQLAIYEGANFLKIGSDNRIRTLNQYPIEYAVTAGKDRALETMLDHMILVPPRLMNEFLGGLLIKAVQACKFSSIKLLIRKYQAPYLPGSFLFQKAVMHQASVDIIEYIMATFMPNHELFQRFGKNKDSILHLAIRFNNFDAFIYFNNREDVPKNVMNLNSFEPIDLLASLPYKSTFIKTFMRKHPEILLNWTDDFGNDLLHLAAHYNRLTFVKCLIEDTNIPIDRKNHDNLTPLLVSYLADKRDIALYLVKKGADIFHKDVYDFNILMLAAKNHDFKFLRSCLETINPSESEEDLKVFSEHLINEQKLGALAILFEYFPFLNKQES